MVNYENNGAKSLIQKKYDKPYVIKDKQKKIAEKMNLVIRPSENHLKKLDVFRYQIDKETGKQTKLLKKVAEIGGRYQDGKWYGDYASYLKDPKDRYGNKVDAEERKRLYKARHRHERKLVSAKDKKKDPRLKTGFTPSYYADAILWS